MFALNSRISLIENSLSKLIMYIEASDYKGYDPYDILNSKFKFSIFGRWGPIIATQLHKRNPINIRRLMMIQRSYNPKGMGLLLHAYSLLYRIKPQPPIKEMMDFIFNWLCNNYSTGYSGFCWGLGFPYSSTKSFLPANMPSTVVTAFVGRGIFEYYLVTRNFRAKEILRSCCDFVLNDIPITEYKNGICFSYTPIRKDICFNATMLASELLAINYFLTQEVKLKDFARLSVDFTIAHQHRDGRWNYSIDENGQEKEQVDFHQGFILNSIFDYMKYTVDSAEKYRNALIRGSNYYYHNQFLQNGQSIWRVPQKWPIDIHNQSQGIITFSKLASLSPDYLKFSLTIALWTIKNMQDAEGYFYYQKGRFVTNKIPYMRWSQAWMMLGLVTLSRFLGIKNVKRSQLGQTL
jgi:hypothetical protein